MNKQTQQQQNNQQHITETSQKQNKKEQVTNTNINKQLHNITCNNIQINIKTRKTPHTN